MIDPRSTSLLLGISGIFLCMLWRLRKEVSLWLLVPWAYFVLHALNTGLAPWYMPPDAVPKMAVVHIMKAGVSVALSLIVIPLFAFFAQPLLLKKCDKLIVLLMAADAIWILAGHNFGLLNSWSFDASVMAIYVPMVLKLKPKWARYAVLGLYLLVIASVRSSTAVACLGVGLLITYYDNLIAMLGLISGGVALAWIGDENGRTLLYSSGRFSAWSKYMGWWHEYASHWFGLGSGSFDTMGALMPVQDMRLVIMHNDYLQVLFETGRVGLLLFLVVVGFGLWYSRKSRLRLAMSLAYCVCMLTYFPLHFFIPQMIGLFLLRDAQVTRAS